MIYDEQWEVQTDGDKRVLEYLEANSYHRCLDIGGVHRPWASKFVTTYVDMVTFEGWKKRYPDGFDIYPEVWSSKLIHGDCENDAVWRELVEDVGEHGKYDFVICSQVLEHLVNPQWFLERLPFVADEGYIAVPNKLFELGRGREFTDEGLERCGMSGYYRGAAPHRWIFTIKEKALWGFPKLGMLEFVKFGFEDKLKHHEPFNFGTLGFMWKDDIPVHIISDLDIDFPDPQEAIELYRRELEHGL